MDGGIVDSERHWTDLVEDVFEAAVAELGVPIEECVVVEDSVNGTLAASRSGAHVVALRTTVDESMDRSPADELATDALDRRDSILDAVD